MESEYKKKSPQKQARDYNINQMCDNLARSSNVLFVSEHKETQRTEEKYMIETPVGNWLATDEQVAPYIAMSDEELKAEIKKPFVDPFAFAVYRKRLCL